MFHIIDDAYVILRTKTGVYRQAKVYSREGFIYAGYGGGFIRLRAPGTSNPHVSWEGLEGVNFATGRHGNLTFAPFTGSNAGHRVGEVLLKTASDQI